MIVKFYVQRFYNRTEIILNPAIGIIIREDDWTIAIVWLLWSVSFIFDRRKNK